MKVPTGATVCVPNTLVVESETEMLQPEMVSHSVLVEVVLLDEVKLVVVQASAVLVSHSSGFDSVVIRRSWPMVIFGQGGNGPLMLIPGGSRISGIGGGPGG